MLLFVLLYMIVIGSITSAKPSSLAVDSLNPSGAADDSGIDLFGSASVFIPETADQDLSIGPGEGGTDTATDGFLDKTAIDPPDLYMTSDMMLEDQTGLETTFQDPAEDLSSLQNGCNADVTNVAARRRRDSTWPVGIEDANDICVPDTAAQTRTQKEECPEGYTPFCCFGGVTWMHGQWLVKLCNECELHCPFMSDRFKFALCLIV